MADAHKYQAHEVLNRVLNAGEDGLNVDLADSVTVTVDSEFPAAAALADNSGNPTTTSVGSHLLGYDSGNTNWNRVEVDDVGHLQVDVLTITAGDNNIGNVDIASALPAGSNTIGVVDLGATDNAVLDAMAASLALLDNSISSGNELQVDIVAALPAGSNAIGKLAANTGVDIGDVDVTSIIPATGATNLGKAIQSAQGGTDTGVAALVVRNDVLADLSGADGDYAPLQVDKSGALYTIEETGQLGSLFEDGTENITSKQIIAIQFLEDTTFTTLTPSGSSLYIGTANQDGDAIDTSNVFPQGMTIFGRWTGYRLASGTIIAYKGTF